MYAKLKTTRRLQAKTNFLQHSICECGKRSPRQNTEKYIVQFFHCSAVRKTPVLIDTGSRPSPDGTIVFLSLVSIFNKALEERKSQPIHLLQNAWLFQEKDCALGLSRAFQ